ncbi:hypothetical protein SAMN05444159_3486 [Bradyrhizobium lablabi]|uniref:Uncharacterized protein n=1 Tax=Bradyrhizobium lablabi TaxID=722472 RepID=A0A1M6T6B3_9BRAD|nr:hypothetical protein [Bradyrhizobium lablabi]SHK52592.1 hypothetical protein SAMN05444159_3486 [Bradyrhizobium lablabi]
MKRICKGLFIAAGMALVGQVLMAPASAAPPTVTPSPGYDSRLQEQHAARGSAAPVIDAPVVPAAKSRAPRLKRAHHDAH